MNFLKEEMTQVFLMERWLLVREGWVQGIQG